MEPHHRQHTKIWMQLLCFVVVLLSLSIRFVESGCRMQERNPCETICQWNATRNSYDCTLRVIVILPEMDTVEASLPRVINSTLFCDSSRCVSVCVFSLKIGCCKHLWCTETQNRRQNGENLNMSMEIIHNPFSSIDMGILCGFYILTNCYLHPN